MELTETVPPLEDALELQMEGRMFLSKGEHAEAIHVGRLGVPRSQ